MINKKLSNEEKQLELVKYRDLVLATLDYYLANKEMHFKTEDFDSFEHYKGLKIEVIENFNKGRLTKLKQWFRDLTEMQIESKDIKFNKYLQDKTKYDIDIFKSYFQRNDKIIEKGKITTDNQFHNLTIMLDQLCQTEPIDTKKMELINKIINDYENKKTKSTKKPNA